MQGLIESAKEVLANSARGYRHLQLLGEKIETMLTPWSSYSDLLPDSCFHASAQHHMATQLATCIASGAQASTAEGQIPVNVRLQQASSPTASSPFWPQLRPFLADLGQRACISLP